MRQPTVLIADDERVIADTLAIILQQQGFPTVRAYDGESAVELARTSSPDVVICDIIMGGISGVEAGLQIRALCPECRIILISGAAISSELLESAGANGHQFEVLAKPIHPRDLIRCLRGD